ncbi:MOSC domain-containing protein [Saccharopolyspora taberi]|uniref:MOSC N-terminal beta barrel domain-containing protein n=1 Tax=Saccharopolyspora taberi TaxID=60895 RepID=A0ABN3VLX8_9PSEU
MAKIAELLCYPIKGCAGTSLVDSVVTPAGLAHDRGFMVVAEDGVFRTQRRHPRLALVRPEMSTDGERMTLRAPGAEALTIDVDSTGPKQDVELFGKPFKGIDQGPAVAEWLSGFLGAASRLVRVPPDHDRVTDGLTPGTSGYADSCAVLVISRPSLDLLNEKLATPLPMNRFRPNIVVTGFDEPHAEDRMRRVTSGDVELGYAKLATRCAVTTVDQATGTKSGPEPLRTFASYRRVQAGGVAFGAKFAVVQPGKVSVGDDFVVHEWGEPEY